MSIGDLFLLLVRWLHLVSAVAWIGGGLFYLLVLKPAVGRHGDSASPFLRVATVEFRSLVDVCIWTLVITGAILVFSRLTSGFLGAPYIVTLGVKIALALWMFALARAQRHRIERRLPGGTAVSPLRRLIAWVGGANSIVVLGVLVFLLSDLLRYFVEQDLAGG